MDKLIKVGNEYHMMNEDKSGTITVRDTISFLALALFEDICEYRKGKEGLAQQINIETNALNAIAAAQNVIR